MPTKAVLEERLAASREEVRLLRLRVEALEALGAAEEQLELPLPNPTGVGENGGVEPAQARTRGIKPLAAMVAAGSLHVWVEGAQLQLRKADKSVVAYVTVTFNTRRAAFKARLALTNAVTQGRQLNPELWTRIT